MKLLGRLKIKWIKHRWILFCLGCGLAVGMITYNLPIAQGDDLLYLLSSISQGLAAIFALVFTISIFGAQMMQKFTVLDKVIDKWTKALMVLFAIGILLPLIQLKTDYNAFNLFDKKSNLSLAIDLSIATICVLAIIPYLIKVNKTVKYEGGVSKLSEEASEAIDSDRVATVSNRIADLIKLGDNAVNDILENETTNIVSELKIIGSEVAYKEWTNPALKTVIGLQIIGLNAIDNEWKQTTFENIISGLKQIGLKSIEKRLDGIPISMGVDTIPPLGLVIMRSFNSFKAKEIPKLFGSFDFIGMSRAFSVTQEVLLALGDIGVKATDKESKKYYVKVAVASSVLFRLEEIGISAVDKGLSDGTVSLSSFGMFRIGAKAAKFRLSFTDRGDWLAHSVAINLQKIACIAYEKDKVKFKTTCDSSMVYLWVLGAFVKKYLPEYAKDMAITLKKSSKSFHDLFGTEDIRMKAKEYILACIDIEKTYLDKYPNLIDELEAFEDTKLIEELQSFEELYDGI